MCLILTLVFFACLVLLLSCHVSVLSCVAVVVSVLGLSLVCLVLSLAFDCCVWISFVFLLSCCLGLYRVVEL